MKAVEVVSAIIENERGEVLIAQRPEGKHLAGFWEFPGGKIEDGETPQAALIRELDEELNLQIQIRESLGIYPHTYAQGHIDLHVFVVIALCEPRPTPDVEVFRWVNPAAIERSELAAADVAPLNYYLANSRPSGF